MKALKEKRIGLRSLLRRGLVILSLFALVFASCADSDGSPSDTTPPPPPAAKYKPARIEITSWPTKDSYEGKPLDLTGLVVRVFYDGGPENNKDLKYGDAGVTFSTYPHTAVGVLATVSGATAWVPQEQYTLLWYSSEADKVFTAVLDLKEPVANGGPGANGKTVKPISRAATWTDKTTANTYNTYGSDDTTLAWSRGLRLVGDLDAKIYVDDYPDFSKYRLQAEYVGTTANTGGEVKEIDLTPETDWMILPKYDSGSTPATPKNATGDLLITIGSNPLATSHPYVQTAYTRSGGTAYTPSGASSPKVDPGLTIRQPYAEIWVVKEITTSVTAADLPDFFYWMTDDTPYWTKALIDSDATITVTYTGDNPGPKTKTVKQWKELNDVWYNKIFVLTGAGATLQTEPPFAVQGITDTAPLASDGSITPLGRNRNPRIKLSYRGAYAYVTIPVYTRPTGLAVTAKSGDPSVPVDMRPRDNDVGAMNAKAFDSLVDAVVTFQAYYDSSVTTTLTVKFDDAGAVSGKYPAAYVTTAPAGITPTGADGAPGAANSNAKAKLYSNNFGDLSENSRNNGRQTAVRFVYTSPDYSATSGVVQVGSRTLRGTVQVDWSNIQ